VDPAQPERPLTTVLLVDDQDDDRTTTKWFLTSFGYFVIPVRTAEEALAVFNPELHDLVVTDNRMPGITGIEMAHIIKLRSPSTPILMYTGLPPTDQRCLDAIVQRPAHLLALKSVIDQLLVDRRPEAGGK
jgi:CheY-like chemotaxis protein